MKILLQIARLLAFALAMLCAPSLAASATNPDQVRLDLIKKMESDGLLSGKMANEAKLKYVDPKGLAAPAASAAKDEGVEKGESLWGRFLSWSNFFKAVAIIMLLVAFSGWIAQLASGLMFIIAKVPKEVYQVVFLSFTGLVTLRPDLIWASQSFYLALFGAFGNIIILSWVIQSHPELQKALARLFSLGLPPASVMSFWGVLYFGALALAYESQIFGFFAAVCLSGMLSFTILYRPGVLMLDFREKWMPAVVFGHLAILSGYAVMKATGALPAQAALFAVGLEYYCTIAMCVGFLVGASPFQFSRDTNRLGYMALFIIVAFAAVGGYFMFDLKVIASVICCFAVLLALEWIGYCGYKAGFLFGTFVMGLTLYGASLLAEQFGSFIVLRLA